MKNHLVSVFCFISSILAAHSQVLERSTIGKIEYDSRFHDLHLDFRDIESCFPTEEWKGFLREFLLEQKNDVHMVILKIDPKNVPLYMAAINLGFKLYYGSENLMELTHCLKSHGTNVCSFPPFHTVYTGTTVVLVNKAGEVLCVKEKLGGETGWKAITGRVETETGELPIQAAIREVDEELGIHLNENEGVLIGIQYTRDKKGKFPDINFVYLFEIEEVKYSLQDSEIEEIKWVKGEEFVGKKFHELPHISSLIIEHALQKRKAVYFVSHNAMWEDGTSVILYSGVE
jgi:8-oxo-dGTP pyrophosphatase MutT (NUDIX family)